MGKAVIHQRKQRTPRKLDREAVLALHEKGLSTMDIAKHQRVAPSTVWRFLEQIKPERASIQNFKRGRADVLARLQAKSLMTQELILDSLAVDGVVDALTVHQKGALLVSLNAQAGTLYDKERLETGRSTSNVTSLGQIMGRAFQDLANPACWDDAQCDDEAAQDDSDDEDAPS